MRFFLLLFLCVATHKLSAQEAVAVSKEPMHKNVFENHYLRVLDVRIAPGDTTLFHKHETPSVFISLNPVRTGSQVIIEDGDATVLTLDRRITFEGFYKSPRIHRVWNRDTSTFHVMDVEVLTKGDRNLDAPIAIDGITQLFDAPPVRTYRLILKSNGKLLLKRNVPVLIVALEDGNQVLVNKKPLAKQGDFLFVQPSGSIELSNNADRDCAFALLELK